MIKWLTSTISTLQVWWFLHSCEWPWRALYLVIRFFQGARRVRLGPGNGIYCDDGGEMIFGGACPVQGEGVFDGYPCYFRSRGERWSFEVFAPDDLELMMESVWCHEEREFYWPDGGYLHPDEVRTRIEKALELWRQHRRDQRSVVVG